MKKLSLLILTLFCAVGMALAQRTVSGVVTDSGGEALIGADVYVENSTLGTVTDLDGSFSIDVPEGTTQIAVSYTGYQTQAFDITSGDYLEISLVEGELLDEVVLVGYGSAKKSELTGSTVQVGSEAIAQLPVATVDQVLQGKVAGLVFNGQSGTPGSTTDIRIRGVSSITAGNDPLYVIDGVPMINNNVSATTAGSSLSMLSSLNNNNIETITVLKDASATAQYGARGANGVIVITTKKGKKGKTSFNFSTTYGISNDAIKGPRVLTAAERETLAYEAVYNTFKDQQNLENVEAAGVFFRENIGAGAQYQRWIDAGRPETNWGDLITNKNAPMREYNLSATGGDDSYSFYAALGYYDQESTVIGSEFNKTTGQLNFTKSLTPSLTFSTTNTAAYTFQDGLLENSAYFSSPRTAKYFMNPLNQAYNKDGSINTNLSGSLPNPLYIAANDIDDSKFTRIITNNSLTWDTPIENLSFTTRANIDYLVYNYKRYRNPVEGDGASSGGSAWQTNNNINTLVIQNSLNYSMPIMDEHKLTLTGLQEWQKNKNYELSAEGEKFADVGLVNLSSAGNPASISSEFEDWAIASYMLKGAFSAYQGKYVLDATVRREGSSRFSPENRWGNFWSVGAAWNIHREVFLEDNDFVSDLKLRAAYGVTGNAAIELNRYQALLNFDSDYNAEGASYPGTFGNKDLSWETSKSLDAGIDFGLLKNRINGSFSYFRRVSDDLLLDVPLSLTTGFDSQTRNIGTMENKGIELELEFDVVRKSNFNFTIGGNVATANNKVTALAKDLNGEAISITNEDLSVLRTEVGHSVWSWYMPTWAGVNSETGNEEWYVNGVDGEKTTNFNEAKRVFQGGSAIPKLTAGINIHLDFLGFFVDAGGYYARGHKVYEAWHRYTNGTDLFSTVYFQGVSSLLDRWQKPGDQTRFGKFEYTGRPWQRHSKFLYDGDYFRVKNVTVGYDFNSKLTSGIGLESVRVFARGTNLFTWVKDKNLAYDPEVSAFGETSLTTPPVKSLVLGVNVKF